MPKKNAVCLTLVLFWGVFVTIPAAWGLSLEPVGKLLYLSLSFTFTPKLKLYFPD
jgi:hypothetical protein